jgi:hypothetical protein
MEKSAANIGQSQGSCQGTKERTTKQQHLTIPNKGMELSSSAETLSGKLHKLQFSPFLFWFSNVFFYNF